MVNVMKINPNIRKLTDELDINLDTDDSDDVIAVLFFHRYQNGHSHIELTREEALKLFEWLGDNLKYIGAAVTGEE